MSVPFVASVPPGLGVQPAPPVALPPPPAPAVARIADSVPPRGRAGPPAGRPGIEALGPLAEFAEDRAVTDLFINGEGGLWIDRGGGPERHPGWTGDEADRRRLAVRLVAAGGRHVDEASPCVDVRLPGGIRVHAVLPPVAPHGTLLSVRIPREGGWSLADLGRGGMFDEPTGRILRRAVSERWNVLITGAGGCGKTTLLAALLGEAPPNERIVAIEDVAELQVAHPHFVGLETRQANLEGAGGVELARLLREALRMRPDRLVLGECRGAELRELLAALNTGHDGGAGTLHANSLEDVPSRLEALGALAGMSAEAVARQSVSAIHLVVHLERLGGRRRVAAFGGLVLGRGDRLGIEAGATPIGGTP